MNQNINIKNNNNYYCYSLCKIYRHIHKNTICELIVYVLLCTDPEINYYSYVTYTDTFRRIRYVN